MVQKFYALLRRENQAQRVINAFEALRLVDQAEILTVKERSVLFDLDTLLNVFPVKGRGGKGQPYFKYYAGENNIDRVIPESFTYSQELISFLGAFESINRFIIKDIFTKQDIIVFPNKMEKLKRIDFKSDYYEEDYAIVKFYVDISYTKPYSLYYKWNGHIALEFMVSSKSSPPKRRELGEQGIPLFEAQAKFPQHINIPSEFVTEEQFRRISEQIKETYQNKNYKLLGVFKNEAITYDENKEKYQILKTFEEQCEELQKQLASMQEKYKQYQEKVHNLKKISEQLEHKIVEYKRTESYYNQLKKDNIQLKKDNVQLNTQNNDLISEKYRLQQKANKLQLDNTVQTEKMTALLNRNLWDRLFNKQ